MEEKKFKTIAFAAGDKYGCGYYRMFLPSVSLCRIGIPAHLMTMDRTHLYDMADTLVIQRPADPGLETLVDEAHSNGVKVVFELDDNLWSLPKWNQAYPFWTKHRLSVTERILAKCDGVTTTTEPLAEVLSQWNDNITIVPNAIFDHNYIEMPQKLEVNRGIIIGWIGSSFHMQDTKVFNDLIPLVLDKYQDIGFLTMGEPLPKSLGAYFNRVISLPFVEAIYYHTILSSFTMNIGLAPLVVNDFNRCKSPIKLIEYLYTNTFPICSDIEPYRSVKKEYNDSCMLIPTNEHQAGSVDDWMDAIDYYIKNIDKCTEQAQKGREFVLTNYNIETDKMRNLYKKAYFIE